MTTTTTPNRRFPTEISCYFLTHLDWVEAWKNRIVCHSWNHYVQHNLAPCIWLRDVKIMFGWTADKEIYPTFTFERMAEGHDAIFADNANKSSPRINTHLSLDRPIVTMSDFAHDITIPGLRVDWERMELRLHWRDLLVQFLSTEKKAKEMFATNLKKQYESAREMKAQITTGLLNEGEAFKRLLRAAGNAHREAYYTTRTARIGYHDIQGEERLIRIRHLLFRGIDLDLGGVLVRDAPDLEGLGGDDEWDPGPSDEDYSDAIDAASEARAKGVK